MSPFQVYFTGILTVGPGGPTFPGDPGKPVGPWKIKYNYWKFIAQMQIMEVYH